LATIGVVGAGAGIGFCSLDFYWRLAESFVRA